MSATEPVLPQDVPALLTLAEVARLHKRDPETVTRWAKAGKVDSILTPSGQRRYPSAQFARLLAASGWPL